jgi:hypothetical protein
MKRKIILSVVLNLLMIAAFAQDSSIKGLQNESNRKLEDDTAFKSGWKNGGLFTLNVAQGSLSNWQGGGDKSSFSAIGFLNLFARKREGKNLWDNTLDLGYGYINTTSLGSRKSDYQLSKKWYAGTLFNFRSQFAPGYTYEKAANGTEIKTLTSKFLAPAYILLSLGFDFRPVNYFSIFISPVTERWILVNDDFLSSIGAYGVEPGKKSKNELGAFLSAEFKI